MKTRSGFVSNSSSMSFVVPVPKDLPKTIDNWLDYFGISRNDDFWELYGDECISIMALELINRILNSINNNDPLTEEELKDNFNESIFYYYWNNLDCDEELIQEYKKIELVSHKEQLKYRDYQDELRDKMATQMMNRWLTKNNINFKDYDLYEFVHEDKGTKEYIMHEGKPYESVLHKKFNNH